MKRSQLLTGLLVVLLVALAAKAGRNWKDHEVALSSDERKKLDTFEGVLIDKADKLYGKGDYRTALPLYKRFLMEYPRSKIVAYAVLRKARCLHKDGKRFKAIKEYNEVLDYFPNHIKYASAALFFQGLAHWENGHKKDAMKCWAEMARDKDYRTHVLAATAINRLADHLAETNEVSKAIPYYKQVAIDFRRSNSSAADHAIDEVAKYYIATNPNEESLREFYEKVKTFHGRPRNIDGETIKNEDYWKMIRQRVERFGKYWDENDTDRRERFYRYWAQQMEGKFPSDDEFQIDLANYHYQHEKDRKKWFDRLDSQYANHQEKGAWGRTVRWIRLYADHETKVNEYYRKLDLTKMTNGQLITLMKVLYEDVGEQDMAANVFEKILLGKLTDEQKTDLAGYMARKDIKITEAICQSFKDKDLGQMVLLRGYKSAREYEKGIKLGKEVANIPDYSREALWITGEMYESTKKYKDAIRCYRQADDPPDTLWAIANCYEKAGEPNSAIAQLKEIEAFFKKVSPRAALAIAHVHGRSGGKKRTNTSYVAALRAVLKKYPKSSESSDAHNELERMNVKTGGGVDVE
jgi:tetratricopeptide (TPR) repeat protein